MAFVLYHQAQVRLSGYFIGWDGQQGYIVSGVHFYKYLNRCRKSSL
jgi:hypothetical protein